jgi:two-component system response regulator
MPLNLGTPGNGWMQSKFLRACNKEKSRQADPKTWRGDSLSKANISSLTDFKRQVTLVSERKHLRTAAREAVSNIATILLVEDNATDEKLTLRALSAGKVPANVEVAHDGQEALDYLFSEAGGEYSQAPDLILLDIKLPKVSGLEVLEAIRKNEKTESVPVVMLTSSDDIYDMATSYRLGANSYIRKTEDYDQFMEHIRLAGLYWIVINKSP